jgi:CheY-like chemotaxis protein
MGENKAPSILVVDDDRGNLSALLRLLHHNGYRAHGASGYHEALKAYARDPCRLLVSDIALPDGSGLDLMTSLRAQGLRAGIAVSGYTSREDQQAALHAGFTAYLTKPVQVTELLQQIESLFGSPQ